MATHRGQEARLRGSHNKPDPSDSEPSVNFTLGPGDIYARTNGRLTASGITLLDYVRFAYKLTDGQVNVLASSAPAWISTERFAIQAKSELPEPTKDQMRLMMQSLLAERFHLAVHEEMREMPVLALALVKAGKLGPQLQPHAGADSTCPSTIEPTDGKTRHSTLETSTPCGGLIGESVPGAPTHIRMIGPKVPLTLLAAHLGDMGHYARPVVDRTGLSGTFDLALEWGPDEGASLHDRPDPEENQASLQEALRTQLGLKLERTAAASVVILIDHLDRKPAKN